MGVWAVGEGSEQCEHYNGAVSHANCLLFAQLGASVPIWET